MTHQYWSTAATAYCDLNYTSAEDLLSSRDGHEWLWNVMNYITHYMLKIIFLLHYLLQGNCNLNYNYKYIFNYISNY